MANDASNQIILAAIMAGQIVMSGEWRGAKPEKIKFTYKKTGAAREFSKLTHVVECGENKTFESVSVTEMLKDGIDAETAPVPFKRGDRVLIACKSVESDFGARSVTALAIVKI